MFNFLQRPELTSALLASMQDGLSILDTDGVHTYVNDALCEMLGFTREELLGTKPPHPYWPSEQLANINAAFERTLRGDTGNFELIFQCKDGTRIEVIVAPSVLRDDRGETLAYFATVKDISERKRLERSLLASEQRWRSIAENPFDFVVLIDRHYRYTYVNHTAPGILPEQLIAEPLLSNLPTRSTTPRCTQRSTQRSQPVVPQAMRCTCRSSMRGTRLSWEPLSRAAKSRKLHS